MEEAKPLLSFILGGFKFNITLPIVEEWAIMAVIMVLVLIFARKFETVPRGSQVWVETLVDSINGIVKSMMGDEFKSHSPYVGTIIIFLLMLNLLGLTGLTPPTSQYSVALGLAITSFLVIQGTALKRNGVKGYLRGMEGPLPAMAVMMFPLNVIERFTLPVSLSLRLFGNMFAASFIMELLYKGLMYVSKSLFGHIPLFALILPIPLHVYFDLFDGTIQMVIFVMLTMVNIKLISEE